MTTLEQAREIVKQLSRDDREVLGVELLTELEKDPGYDEYWEAEIARRVKAINDGTATYVSWEELRRQMRERLDAGDEA